MRETPGDARKPPECSSWPSSPGSPVPPRGSGRAAPTLGHFRPVLAQEEGQTLTPSHLGAYEATHQPPPSFLISSGFMAGHAAR